MADAPLTLTGAELAWLLSAAKAETDAAEVLGVPSDAAVADAGFSSLAVRGLVEVDGKSVVLTPPVAAVTEGLTNPEARVQVGLAAQGIAEGAVLFATGKIRFLACPRAAGCFDMIGLDPAGDIADPLVAVAQTFLNSHNPAVASFVVDLPAGPGSMAVAAGGKGDWVYVAGEADPVGHLTEEDALARLRDGLGASLAGHSDTARSRHYDPAQPRVPDGENAGQWVSGGGVVGSLLDSLKKTGSAGGVYFDDNDYLDWSLRQPDGSFGLEIGGDDGTVQADATLDQVRAWHNALSRSLAENDDDIAGLGDLANEHDKASLSWVPQDADGERWDVTATGTDGDEVTFDWPRERMEQVHTALTTTLLADSPTDDRASLVGSLAKTGTLGHVRFDDGQYWDWSSRGNDGSFALEVGGDTDTATVNVSTDDLTQLQSALTGSLENNSDDGFGLSENNPSAIYWEPADGGDNWHVDVTDADGGSVLFDWPKNRLQHLHAALTASLIADAVSPASARSGSRAGLTDLYVLPDLFLDEEQDTPTGAMIALVPTANDAAWLALPGGEPVDELHLTLWYLGEAADIPPDVQAALVNSVRSMVERRSLPAVQARAFGANWWNPTSDKPAWVLAVGDPPQRPDGQESLAVCREMMAEAWHDGMVPYEPPPQHSPWAPHICLAYSGDPGIVGQVASRVGPLTFDAVRVVFAGRYTDIPLNTATGDASQQGRSHMPTADGYIHVDELPELLRAHGWVPAQQATVSAQAARSVLAAFGDTPIDDIDDNSPDGDLDDDSRDVLAAIDEFEQRQIAGYYTRRADFKPDLHPRWPSGSGHGGKFRPAASQVMDSLKKWQDKGGHKSGEKPFAHLSHHTLKKVATGRGLYEKDKETGLPKLLPGSTKPEIEHRLLKDLRSKEGARNKPVGVDRKSWNTLRALAGKEKTTVGPDEIDGLMTATAKVKPPPFNLSNLKVSGPGNENLFQRHLRSRPRDTMPQLPTGMGEEGAASSGKTMEDFEKFLGDKGVGFEYGQMDPRELVASQSELSGPKVAKLYGFMKQGGWKPGGVMIIAKNGDEWAVVDGHHRWAAAAGVSIANGGQFDVDVLKIDAQIDDVLGTPENPKGIVMDFASFEGLGADREG